MSAASANTCCPRRSRWERLWFGDTNWAQHVWITTLEIIGAFVLAAVAGIALGVAIAWSPLMANALVPFLVFVNTCPRSRWRCCS